MVTKASLLLQQEIDRSSAIAISAQTGISDTALRGYADGSHKPRPDKRSQIEKAIGIPVTAWDDVISDDVNRSPSLGGSPIVPPIDQPRAPSLPSLAREDLSARDRAREIVQRLEGELSGLGANVPVNHRAALWGQLQAATERLARLDGADELTPAQIVKTKAWADVAGVLASVLRRYPGAAEDLRDGLDALKKGEAS